MFNFRTVSNFDDMDEEEESANAVADASPGDLTGVESLHDVSSQEAAEINNIVAGPSNSNSSSTAGTSSSDSSNGPSRVHIQKPRAKRITESAKKREELTNTFIELVRKEQDRELQADDELDSSFAAFGARMRKHLNENQREDVLQEMNRVLSEAINNVRKGLPAVRHYVQPPPMPQQPPPRMQAAPLYQDNQPQQQMNGPPPPPNMQAAPSMFDYTLMPL